MFEEVCLVCGRPVDADGRTYCSDECEIDDMSLSLSSAASSAYPSPYIHSAASGVADVPALVPSALGSTLAAYKSHRTQHSISSSSASSAVWSAPTDDEDEAEDNDALYDDSVCGSDAGLDGNSFKSNASSHRFWGRRLRSGLSYARRPSATNNRSTIPTLHKRTSSASNPHAAEAGLPCSAPAPQYNLGDDFSDCPSSSPMSTNSRALHSYERENENIQDSVAKRSKRNRASLPAYFSLLQMTSSSSSSSRSQRSPSSLQTLNAVSRSLHSSPPTPREVFHKRTDLTALLTHVQARPQAAETTPRGRGRQRVADPEDRSASSRRSTCRSPPRQVSRVPYTPASPPPRLHADYSRARLDSVEKVFDWVVTSPVVGRGRAMTRRNSSPPAKPKYEFLYSGEDSRGEFSADVHSLERDDDERDDRAPRGRRRRSEYGRVPPQLEMTVAPGNGRDGLRTQEHVNTEAPL